MALSLAGSADMMDILGAVHDVRARYLRHIGRKERPPPISPPRNVGARLDYDDCVCEDHFAE